MRSSPPEVRLVRLAGGAGVAAGVPPTAAAH